MDYDEILWPMWGVGRVVREYSVLLNVYHSELELEEAVNGLRTMVP